jgi:3-dehydroquinate synthetase
MQHDKKTEQGQLRFVLPRRMGAVEVVSSIGEDLVGEAMRPVADG